MSEWVSQSLIVSDFEDSYRIYWACELVLVLHLHLLHFFIFFNSLTGVTKVKSGLTLSYSVSNIISIASGESPVVTPKICNTNEIVWHVHKRWKRQCHIFKVVFYSQKLIIQFHSGDGFFSKPPNLPLRRQHLQKSPHRIYNKVYKKIVNILKTMVMTKTRTKTRTKIKTILI